MHGACLDISLDRNAQWGWPCTCLPMHVYMRLNFISVCLFCNTHLMFVGHQHFPQGTQLVYSQSECNKKGRQGRVVGVKRGLEGSKERGRSLLWEGTGYVSSEARAAGSAGRLAERKEGRDLLLSLWHLHPGVTLFSSSQVWKLGWSPKPGGDFGTVFPEIPVEFLQEKEILTEFIYRINTLGTPQSSSVPIHHIYA